MRLVVPFLLASSAAAGAWESSSAGPVCRLSHATEMAAITVSHDPRVSEPYAIEIERAEAAWNNAPLFVMRFDGPGALTISTDRHRLSKEGAVLTVMDKGFGNVLSGLQENFAALAILGGQTVLIPLDGAALAVDAFRDCVQATKV